MVLRVMATRLTIYIRVQEMQDVALSHGIRLNWHASICVV